LKEFELQETWKVSSPNGQERDHQVFLTKEGTAVDYKNYPIE